MFGLSIGEAIAVILAGGVVTLAIIFPASIICGKLGLSPWLGLLTVVPAVNVLLLWYLAFAPAATTGSRAAAASVS